MESAESTAPIPLASASFGARLRAWRERRLLSQAELAKRAGLSARTVRRLEADATIRAQGGTLRRLVDALNLSEAEQAALRAAAAGVPVDTPFDDPVVRPPAAAGSASATESVIPRQLPAPAAVFTGRAAEIAVLDRLYDANAVVITAIDGMAGIGKTALAVHVAHRIADQYPDGQLFLDLHGYTKGMQPAEPNEVLDRVLRNLGVPATQIPIGLNERAALYRSRLAGRRMLILLDNATTESQIAPLLPGTAGCLVLITSRRRLSAIDHTITMSLDALPPPEAIALLIRVIGEQRLVAESREVLAEFVELCGRLPLAIRIAAGRLLSHRSWTAGDLVERLRDQSSRLAELESGRHSVTAALELSYQNLAPDVRRTYRLCGVFPGADIDVYGLTAMAEIDLADAARQVDHLLDSHLLQEPNEGRYALHDLVRAHAVVRASSEDSENDRLSALRRLLDHYSRSASLAMDIAYPFDRDHRPPVSREASEFPIMTDQTDALLWLDTELFNLLAAAQSSAGSSWPDPVLHLSAVLHRHLRTRGRYGDAEALHELALAAARRIGNRRAELDATIGLGSIRRLQGRHHLAVGDFERALEIARLIRDRRGEVTALTGLGGIHRLQGRHEQAARVFTQAQDIATTTRDRRGELAAVTGFGHVLWLQGHHEQAGSAFAQAHEIARITENRTGELDALTGLGWVRRQQGHHADARAIFEQTLDISRALGSRDGELSAMIGLGWAHRVQGRDAQAAVCYQQTLDLAREIGNRNMQYEALQGLGRLHRSMRRTAQALDCYRKALDLAAELAQPADEARAHDGLAHVYLDLREHRHARQNWQSALTILSDLGMDFTEDEEVTAAAIRAQLGILDQGRV